MSRPGYVWRQLNEVERRAMLEWRMEQRLPWHRTPHRLSAQTNYHITAACYEHRQHIGYSNDRLAAFCAELLDTFSAQGAKIHAWCVLPNHYHVLVGGPNIPAIVREIGRMHGRLAFRWNGEENCRGRQVWCGCADRAMRGERHFWATVNYIHNNPVRHRYVDNWLDWRYSSIHELVAAEGITEVERVWRDCPVLDYGQGWDDPDL